MKMRAIGRKAVCMLLLACLVVGAAGCGKWDEGEGSEGNSHAEDIPREDGHESRAEENDPREEKRGFSDVGNDPNNIWQSLRGGFAGVMAFSDEHMYYSAPNRVSKEKSGLWKARLDGTGRTKLSEDNVWCLNLYEGNLYGYVVGNASSKKKGKILRINTDTGETETLAELDGVQNMLAASGVLYYVLNTSDTSMALYGIDLDTLQTYELTHCRKEGGSALTVGGDQLYVYVQTSSDYKYEIYTVSLQDVKSGIEPRPQCQSEENLGYPHGISFTPEGCFHVEPDKSGLTLRNYEKLDGENQRWEAEGAPYIECDRDWLFNGLASAAISAMPRFILGDNLVAMTFVNDYTSYLTTNTENQEIYFFRNMDLSAGEVIAQVDLNAEIFGAWNNVFYVVEQLEDGERHCLVTVDADGNVSRTDM